VHASRALTEYRGELLPGVYEDWVLQARAEIERQCTALCDLLVQARERRGDLPGATAAARRRIQLQPLEETGYRTLMRLQAEAGDRAGAVSTYHHCASVLERELGVEPDAATYQAFQRLMARRARADVAAAAAGRCGLVLIRGGVGVGKTRLVDEGQDRVRDSYRGNYDRLARIKGRYDPDNTFRINQNIRPAR
jgi:hypothetical protein